MFSWDLLKIDKALLYSQRLQSRVAEVLIFNAGRGELTTDTWSLNEESMILQGVVAFIPCSWTFIYLSMFSDAAYNERFLAVSTCPDRYKPLPCFCILDQRGIHRHAVNTSNAANLYLNLFTVFQFIASSCRCLWKSSCPGVLLLLLWKGKYIFLFLILFVAWSAYSTNFN